MIITNLRSDWLFVWEKNSKGKYSACILIPKNDPQLQAIQAQISRAIKVGIEKGKFTEAQTRSASFKPCLRDGDVEIETEGRPVHYKGHMFFNANNKTQPGIVGPDTKPLMDQSKLYSGCFCHYDVNFYPFNNESKGIGAALNHIMLYKEGERLDGRVSAEEAFAGMQVDESLQ